MMAKAETMKELPRRMLLSRMNTHTFCHGTSLICCDPSRYGRTIAGFLCETVSHSHKVASIFATARRRLGEQSLKAALLADGLWRGWPACSTSSKSLWFVWDFYEARRRRALGWK
jgi:hypothetical protein